MWLEKKPNIVAVATKAYEPCSRLDPPPREHQTAARYAKKRKCSHLRQKASGLAPSPGPGCRAKAMTGDRRTGVAREKVPP